MKNRLRNSYFALLIIEKAVSQSEVGPGVRAVSVERVTIYDVAKAARVSTATASKALNDTGRMALETRDRIKRIARELGFRPNSLARSLTSKRSFTVGLLTNDTYGRFTLPVMAGISEGTDRPRGVGVPVRHRGRPRPRPNPCRCHARQAGRRHHRHRAGASTGRCRSICPAARARRLRADRRGRTMRVTLLPDDRQGARGGGPPPGRAGPAAHRPRHRARELPCRA